MLEIKYHFNDKPLREFLIAMKEFARDSIAVGVEDAGKHPDSQISISEVAAINEFGTSHIPSRPFIRQTFANTAWVRDVLTQAARRVVHGQSAPASLKQAGRVLADGVRNTLLNGVPPANAEATVDWKGHGDTLIGLTGALYDAIIHKIIPGGR